MNKGSNKHSNKKGTKCETNAFTMGLPGECQVSASKTSMNGFVNGVAEEKKISQSKPRRKERKKSKHAEKRNHVKDTYLGNIEINKPTINEQNGSLEIGEIPNTVSDSTTSTKCSQSSANSTDIYVDNSLYTETQSSCSKSKTKEIKEDNAYIEKQSDSSTMFCDDNKLQPRKAYAMTTVLNLSTSNTDKSLIDLEVDVASNSEDLIADMVRCSLNDSDCANATLTEKTAEVKISSTPVCSTSEQDNANLRPIEYVQYQSELQMPMIMKLIQKDLSEPYSIYTYRYFIHNWPKLCFLAMSEDECVGAIVCKLDLHRKVIKRGYIAMLAVDENFRKRGIGSTLVRRAIQEMISGDADEIVLETEITNKPALQLYEALGFVRDKRLFRYYLNGVDALRLKLWLR